MDHRDMDIYIYQVYYIYQVTESQESSWGLNSAFLVVLVVSLCTELAQVCAESFSWQSDIVLLSISNCVRE